jgi:predicted ATP-grasp superfamily ATP-dependent carboligase
MKRDQRTGQHFIIEPNIGRPTGRSAIAEAGGVEILYTKYCDLANLPLPANREQKYEGVKWIYLMHDIQSSFYYWRRGELTFREWWRSIRGPKYFAVLSWNDPAPFWNHFWGAFLLVIKAQISRLVRNRKTSGAGFASTTGENP